MTNPKKSKTIVNVGVDVGKSVLDIYLHEKDLYWQVENTPAGIRKLLGRLGCYQVKRLVMEATGRYQHLLVEKAFERDLPVCVVKALSVRRYAQAISRTAKTDRIDAQVIAEFAVRVKPPVTMRKSKNLLLIRDLLSRRRQLVAMRTRELNRIKIMGKTLETSCRRIIRVLDQEIGRIERKPRHIFKKRQPGAKRKHCSNLHPASVTPWSTRYWRISLDWVR